MEFVPNNPSVLNPTMWPWFTRKHDRWINTRLLTKSLRPHLKAMHQPVVAVTTIPVVVDLIDKLPVDRWVYYCVDDFGQWPGLDQATLQRMEKLLFQKADQIIAASENLQNTPRSLGRESKLLTHGVDLEHWQSGHDTELPEVVESLERPLLVFWGVIDQRMDVEFLEALARDMARGTILLVGPIDNPDPALWNIPHIAHLPPLAYSKLPALAREASVLIMPYRDLPVTRAMQPLKLKEYLATGKPTVVRDLPATRPWAQSLDVATTPSEFSSAVIDRVRSGLDDSQQGDRQRLVHESWQAKAEAFERMALFPSVAREATVASGDQ